MPHTRSRYSGSLLTSSTCPDPFMGGQRARALALRYRQVPPGEAVGVRKKLTRVLAATINGPMGIGSRRQASPRPQRGHRENDVTGRYRRPFSRRYGAARSGIGG
jgi:hypothetical protein